MVRPSGDHAGLISAAGSAVRRRRTPEAKDLTHTLVLSWFSPFAVNATKAPSGDNAGSASVPRKEVTGTARFRAAAPDRIIPCSGATVNTKIPENTRTARNA